MLVPRLIEDHMVMDGAFVVLPGGRQRRRYPDGRVIGRGPWPDAAGIPCIKGALGLEVWDEIHEFKHWRGATSHLEKCEEGDPENPVDQRRSRWACYRWFAKVTQFWDYIHEIQDLMDQGTMTFLQYTFSGPPGLDFVDVMFFGGLEATTQQFGSLLNLPIIVPPLVNWNDVPTYFTSAMDAGDRGLLHAPEEQGAQGVGDLNDFEESLREHTWPEEAEVDDFDRGWTCSRPGSVPDVHDCTDWHFDRWNL